MPHEVAIPRSLRSAGWRAKVFDDEGPEEPHVSVIFKGNVTHRISLRTGSFLVPPGGAWNDLHPDIRAAIEAEWAALADYWDQRNPHNPTRSKDR